MEKIRSLRFHAEEKGHWIVAFGYAGESIFWDGHNSVLTGLCYAMAAMLATHHSVRVRACRKMTEQHDSNN